MFVSSFVAVIAKSLPPPPSLSITVTLCLHGCDQFRSPEGRYGGKALSPKGRYAWDSIGTSALLAIAAASPPLCLSDQIAIWPAGAGNAGESQCYAWPQAGRRDDSCLIAARPERPDGMTVKSFSGRW